MSITQTLNTNLDLQKPSDEIKLIVGPYSNKIKVSLTFDKEKDRTQQEFADECDINNIMSRYMKTGVMEFVNKHAPQYEDTTGWEFQQAMETVANGQSLFAAMPAKLRDQFKNDPATFLEFINDPNNARKAAEMGLLSPEASDRVLNPPPKEKTSPEASKPSDKPDEKPAA